MYLSICECVYICTSMYKRFDVHDDVMFSVCVGDGVPFCWRCFLFLCSLLLSLHIATNIRHNSVFCVYVREFESCITFTRNLVPRGITNLHRQSPPWCWFMYSLAISDLVDSLYQVSLYQNIQIVTLNHIIMLIFNPLYIWDFMLFCLCFIASAISFISAYFGVVW